VAKAALGFWLLAFGYLLLANELIAEDLPAEAAPDRPHLAPIPAAESRTPLPAEAVVVTTTVATRNGLP